MSVLLPQPRLPQTAVPKLLDWGGTLTPPMGGASQRLNRLGNRHSLDIAYPRLKPEPDGRVLMARLKRAKTEGALFPFPQPGLTIGDPGTPVVDGAGAAGSALPLKGMAAGYVIREGQFFSVIVGGRRYLHAASAEATVDGAGKASLPITPMLRVSPPNNAVCEFAQPYIEGMLSGNEVAVELAIARATPATITITEME